MFEVLVVSTVAFWLAVLTVLVLVLVRQVAVLTVRGNNGPGYMDGPGPLDGIAVGAHASQEAMALLPETAKGRALVILTSSTCGPCRELVADLPTLKLSVPTVLLLPGPTSTADPMAELVPPWIRVVRDPDAHRAATELQVNRTPYVFLFDDGRVTAKRAASGRAREIAALVEGAIAPLPDTARGKARLTEEVGHGD